MISIVVPLYNKESAILSTLSSIREQGYKEWECVIVDDGSTDNSAQIVQDFIKEDHRFIYYFKSNGGPSSARNFGVNKAKGDWIVFLDADDKFEKDALSCFNRLISRLPNYDCFAFNFYIESQGKRTLFREYMRPGRVKTPYKYWFYKRFMPRTGAAVFHKRVLIEYPHKEYLRRYEDAEMLFNIFRKYPFYQSDIPVMTYCCDTLAASGARKDIQEDFFAHLQPKGKHFWEQMMLYKYYVASFKLYPEQVRQVYPASPFNPIMELLIKSMNKWIIIKQKISQIFVK